MCLRHGINQPIYVCVLSVEFPYFEIRFVLCLCDGLLMPLGFCIHCQNFPHLHLTTSKAMVIVWMSRGNIILTVFILPMCSLFNGHSPKGPPRFLAECHMSMTKSGLACLLCFVVRVY